MPNTKEPRTFIKAKINNYIKAEITSFSIIKYNTYIIKNVINKLVRPCIKDLILYNVIVIVTGTAFRAWKAR
jgi:hypothetical protein